MEDYLKNAKLFTRVFPTFNCVSGLSLIILELRNNDFHNFNFKI